MTPDIPYEIRFTPFHQGQPGPTQTYTYYFCQDPDKIGSWFCSYDWQQTRDSADYSIHYDRGPGALESGCCYSVISFHTFPLTVESLTHSDKWILPYHLQGTVSDPADLPFLTPQSGPSYTLPTGYGLHVPAGQSWRWGAPDVSGLQFLVVLVLIPAGLALTISLLAVLPSIIKDSGYAPGQSWRAEAEWFGGPQKGVEAAEDLSPQQLEAAESGRGGTSAQW